MIARWYRRQPTGFVPTIRHALRGRPWVRPAVATQAAGTGADLVRGGAQLLAENALLCQPPIVLRRSVVRPAATRSGRALLVRLAGRVRAWRPALLIVRPGTLPRWHRRVPRALAAGVAPGGRVARRSRRKPSRRSGGWRPRIRPGVLSGSGANAASRASGLQSAPSSPHLRGRGTTRPRGQAWTTFPRNHAPDSWAGDFLPVTDLAFRHLYAFFVVARGSRRATRVGVTRRPIDARAARQLQAATPCDARPCSLIRDDDGECGRVFVRVTVASGITELRHGCLDHVLVLGAAHLRRVLRECVAFFNRDRPHQGL